MPTRPTFPTIPTRATFYSKSIKPDSGLPTRTTGPQSGCTINKTRLSEFPRFYEDAKVGIHDKVVTEAKNRGWNSPDFLTSPGNGESRGEGNIPRGSPGNAFFNSKSQVKSKISRIFTIQLDKKHFISLDFTFHRTINQCS